MDGIFETAEWNSRTSPRLLSSMPASGSWLPRRKHCRVAGWLVRVWRGAWSWYTAYWFRDKHHPIYQGLPVSSGGLRHEQYLQGLFPHLFGIVCDTMPFMIMQSLRCIQHISAHTTQRQLVAKVAMFATELCPLVFACVTEVIRIILQLKCFGLQGGRQGMLCGACTDGETLEMVSFILKVHLNFFQRQNKFRKKN